MQLRMNVYSGGKRTSKDGLFHLRRISCIRSECKKPCSSGSPIWSGAASGSGETIEATFATGGAKTLTAKCGTCGEPGKSVNIEVILPEPNQVSFVDNNPGEEHDIYGITDPVWTQDIPTSSAASYTMGKYVTALSKKILLGCQLL